jgi:dipeptidyl aminopeptidase/acylaminoacyl peptidase
MSFRTQKVEQVATIYQPPSFSDDFKSYALVSESSSERPEVAVVDARSSTPRRVTNLNPWLDARSLGRVEKLDITNKSGVATTGYLVHPVGATPGRKAPLVIASYGFQGRFIVTAEWHTTFPAQTLAGRGYAVLLLNTPPLPSAQITVGDPVKARDNEGWQVLASYDAAIDLLVQRGIADPDRIGLYGWSHGAFVVEFVLAHSKRRFGAAIVGEGGDYNPGGYWVFGSASWPAIYRNTFGGPFTAANAKAYLEFSPVLNVDKVQTPLLMEFVAGNAVSGFEFYVPLREAKVPAEMVLYDREAHNFVRPTVRFASMHRKVDWLDFWLLDKEDADPAKAAQYTRWKQLKTEWKR